MKALAPEIRTYRALGILALLHAVALIASFQPLATHGSAGDVYNPVFLRLWCGLTAAWVFWPAILAVHGGRSAFRFLAFTVPAGLLFVPSFLLFRLEAPSALGLPTAVDLTATGLWRYASAYRSGRADAKKDIAAGILATETYGFGAGSGHYAKILRDRYQVDTRAVAGCVIDEQIAAHAAGYNAVSIPEIARRLGQPRLAALQEEGSRLDAEEGKRRERVAHEFTQRMTSLPVEGNVTSESIGVYPEEARNPDNLSDEEIAHVVHAIEKLVARAVPPDAPAAQLSIRGTLTPQAPPTADASASFSLNRAVYDAIRADLKTLPDVRPKKHEVSYSLRISIRSPELSVDAARSSRTEEKSASSPTSDG